MDVLVDSLVPSLLVNACHKKDNDAIVTLAQVEACLPAVAESVGAVVVLDISGYTTLSELLFTGTDNAGGERLFTTINPFFCEIINTLTTYGGDIIKFCGDSIIACWSEQQTVVSKDLVQRVLFCVSEVMKNYDGYKVKLPNLNGIKSSQYELGMHIGVGFGAFAHLFVGEPHVGRSEYLLIGNAMAEAAYLLQLTKRGQVALSRESWTAFQSGVDYRPSVDITDDASALVFKKTAEEFSYLNARREMNRRMLEDRKFLPSIVIKKKVESFLDESAVARATNIMKEGVPIELLHTRLSELRQITTVFLQVREFSHKISPQDSKTFIQKLFEIIHRPLAAYNGRLRQIVFDDKNLTAFMVWGLPPARAMDHLMALFCAIAIRDKMLKSDLGAFSIGISSGPTFTGIIGNLNRHDMNLFGRSINIAARCMSLPLAKGGILCELSAFGESLIEKGGLKFGTTQILKVKGIDLELNVALLETSGKDPIRTELGLAPIINVELKRFLPPTRSFTKSGNNLRDEFMSGGNITEIAPSPNVSKFLAGDALGIYGRDTEIDQIQNWLSKWIEETSPIKKAKALLIFGKSGCGKTTMSRFCEGFLADHSSQNMVILARQVSLFQKRSKVSQ
ncbi:Adenylate cyclase type 10 [Phlyctochytrium planicorne]|nr:Adenylate cyclase type 10 [Phlyctochytrium planicorne]